MRAALSQPARVEAWDGLNLRDDPGQVGLQGAVDGLNFQIDLTGELRSRHGFRRQNDATLGTYWLWVDYFPDPNVSNGRAICITRVAGNVYLSVESGFPGTFGVVSGGFAFADAVIPSAANFGVPGTPKFFYTVASNSAVGTARAYDGSSDGAIAALGKPKYLAVKARSNRLVQGCYNAAADTPSGANGTKSTVFFSDPDAPTTYTSTNWVKLTTGDGEVITGIHAFRDLVIVFKETKMFVFYDEGVNATGGVEFNYHTVDLPRPIYGIFQQGNGTGGSGVKNFAVGTEGIYFLTLDGIFVTDGYQMRRVSGKIDTGVFTKDSRMALRIPDYGTCHPWLSYSQGRLFLSYALADGTTKRTLAYEPARDIWTLWDRPRMVAYWSRTGRTLAAVEESGVCNLYLLGPDYTGDDDTYGDVSPTAITSSYTSGTTDFQTYGQKRLRGVRAYGAGTVTMNVFPDGATTDSLASALTLGTSPARATALHAKSYRGRDFAYKLSSTSAWALSSLALNDYA